MERPRPGGAPLTALDPPPEDGALGPLPDDPVNGTWWPGDDAADNKNNPHLLWIHVHLHHLTRNAQTVSGPALRVAEATPALSGFGH